MLRRLFDREAPRIVNLGWNHGRYLDYWSAVHFLTGIIAGTVASFLGLPALFSVIAITIMAALYEGLEVLAQVAEDVENVLCDIVLVALGSVAILYAFSAYGIDAQTKALILGIAVAADIILIHLGWRSYLAREAKKKGSYRYLKLMLYVITLIALKVVVSSFYFWSTPHAH